MTTPRGRWTAAIAGLGALAIIAAVLQAQQAHSTPVPPDVFSALSNRSLEKRGLVDPLMLDVASVPVSQATAEEIARVYGTPTEVRLVRFRLLDEPAAGEAIIHPEGFPGLEGPVWAVLLAEEPGFTSDGLGRPHQRSARVTSTYNLVLINAETGAFILRMGGELLDGEK